MADYRYLRAFHLAAAHLSFKKAALELGISFSAVSRQIRLLEESLGGELFVRGHRQIMLTQLGNRLLESVAGFELSLGSLQEEPPLRMGCLESVFEFYLVKLIRSHPKVFAGPLDIEIGAPEELLRKMERGQLDLLITNLPPADGSVLSAFKLFTEEIDWAVLGGAPKGKRAVIFSAFEERYSPDERAAPDRIRVNTFGATVALARTGIGNALVARPSSKRAARSSQWIYAVLPNLKAPSRRLAQVATLLRRAR